MDSAVQTMFLALEQGEIAGVDGAVAFLRARPHENLHRFDGRLTCEQTWKPLANALAVYGFASSATALEGDNQFDLVLLRPDRQRDQVLYDMARGLRLLRPGGTLLVALPNDWGAARHEKHLRDLAGEVHTLSKHHCRAFWAVKSPAANTAMLDEWIKGGQPQPLAEDPRFITRPGVFSWDEIDPGSKALADHLPAGLSGSVADLGGGWGYLSQFILEHRPLVREVHLYEADAIALDLARRNLSPFIRQEEGAPVVTCDWADVTEGLGSATFDTVVMNPPFHQGRQADPMLGHKFMAAAMAALRPGGQLWMVANQFLPYERFLTEALPNTHVVWQSGGYKILHGARPQAPEKPPRGWGATPHRKKGRRDTERIRP